METFPELCFQNKRFESNLDFLHHIIKMTSSCTIYTLSVHIFAKVFLEDLPSGS